MVYTHHLITLDYLQVRSCNGVKINVSKIVNLFTINLHFVSVSMCDRLYGEPTETVGVIWIDKPYTR